MINFYIETDLKKCEELWNQFSNPKEIFDLWEFREAFFYHTKIKPYFIVCVNNQEPIGILPLAQHENHPEYELFTFIGDHFIENNKFLVRDNKVIPLLLAQAPKITELSCISYEYKEYVNNRIDESSPKFYVRVDNLKNFEEFLRIFNKKHRKNLNNDLKKLTKLNYKVYHNRIDDFDYLVIHNINRFGENSDFYEKEWIELNRDLINIAYKKGYLELISIEIEKKIEAVEFAFYYNGVYTLINSGSNNNINNLGKLLIAEHIKNAINKKAKIVDFLAYDSGWKRLWNSQEQEMYYYDNNF